MKGLGAGLKVGLLSLVVVIAGFVMFNSVSEQASGDDGVTLWATFRDASGLASKSRVVIAGLTIGEITDRRLEGKVARVDVRVRRGTEIWSNATIFKKSSSLLGEFYLEIDPGTPETYLADGTVVKNRLLEPGQEIENVIEATTTDQVMRSVTETLPRVDKALEEITGLVTDVRGLVNGEIKHMAETLDRTISADAELVTSILQKADSAIGNIDVIVRDVRRVTDGADERVVKILDNVEKGTEDARLLIADARAEINGLGQRVDRTIGYLEETAQNTSNITKKIDDDEGTLGRLVNDPTIADNITDITTDAKNFTSTLFNLQTIVGLHSEYGFLSEQSRSYLGIEIRTRQDKFYLVEIVGDPKGDVQSELVFVEDDTMPGGGSFNRAVTVDYGYRFTFQFGKRYDWVSLRLGIKESTGGVGADLHLSDKFKASIDVFDFTYTEVPRVKLALAYHFFRYLYVYGGVDDAIDVFYDHVEPIAIAGDSINGNQDEEWYQGHDYFLGAGLSFTDSDLSSLLFIAGSALSGITSDN